jgi:hypothetical protein
MMLPHRNFFVASVYCVSLFVVAINILKLKKIENAKNRETNPGLVLFAYNSNDTC